MSADLFHSISLLRLERCDPGKTGLTLCAYLAPERLRDAARGMLAKEYFLEDVSVLETAEGFVAVYHFDNVQFPGRVALRVIADREAAELPSIADIYQGAAWHEREAHDFFGLSFTGNDNLLPLLLPGDATFHPLRKEAKSLKPLAELIEPGEVMREDPGFALFAPPAKPAPASEQGERADAEQPAAAAASES